MLLESLKLLVHAGEDALMTTCNLPVVEVTVSQVRQGQITFPGMAKIGFQGGTLQMVRLGGDSMLCRHLAELVASDPLKSGIEYLAKRFMSQAVDEMEGRYPRGQIENMEVGPQTVFTRGTRSFGLRFSTGQGQLYLLAEVPSRFELEQAKGGEFQSSMISTYLPKDWAVRETISNKSSIDSFLVFLRKVEGDVHVEVPCGDGSTEIRTGILLDQCQLDGQRALRVNLNLDSGSGRVFEVGDKVTAFVGVQDRSIEMDLTYLGEEAFPLVAGASIETAFFNIPDELRVVQRRRAFRIDLFSNVSVEIEAIDEECRTALWFGDEEQGTSAAGRLLDLSFSGARITGDHNEFCGPFPEDTRVRCRLYFPDQPRPVQILGVVRRSTSKLVDRDTYQDELGVEFLVSPEVDRQSLDIIRDYVLKEQRSLLARRIHVSGSV